MLMPRFPNDCGPSHQQSYLKKSLTYSSIFKAYFMKIFAAAKASLVLLKTDAEAAVRKRSSK